MHHRLAGLGILAGIADPPDTLAVVAYAATNIWPNLGAGAVDLARGIFGDKFVSQVENFVLSSEDKLKQIQYSLLKTTPAAPWQTATPVQYPAVHPSSNNDACASFHPFQAMAHQSRYYPFRLATEECACPWQHAGGRRMDCLSQRCERESRGLSDLSAAGPPAALCIGGGGGVYLQATRLHFVLGYEEPASKVFISRPARIPASDMLPGKILAAFNGGFKAQHGHFGVMLDGVTLIPPRDGFGTVAIYEDGKVRLGAWGTDITPFAGYSGLAPKRSTDHSKRADQSPHSVTDPKVWGYTTDGGTATGRSALGISQDGATLYYAVGLI